MDLTLMICLLRNLQKIRIEDTLPAATLISEEADLSRIKYYRNWIAHNTAGYINTVDFLAMWTNACEVNCSSLSKFMLALHHRNTKLFKS